MKRENQIQYYKSYSLSKIKLRVFQDPKRESLMKPNEYYFQVTVCEVYINYTANGI